MGSLFDIQVIDEKYLYYYDVVNKCIKTIDIELRKLIRIKKLHSDVGCDYTVGVVCNDKIIYAPMNCNKILCFDYVKSKTEEIYINDENMFSTSIINDNEDYLIIPFASDASILCYLSTVKKTKCLLELTHSIKKIVTSKQNLLFRNALLNDNRLLLPSFRTNQLIVLDFKTNSIKELRLGNNDHYLITIIEDDDLFYVLAANKLPTIYLLDKKKLAVVGEEVLSEEQMQLLCMIDCGEYILIPQREKGQSFIFNKNTYKITQFDICCDNTFTEEKAITCAKKVDDNHVWLALKDTDRWFCEWTIDTKKAAWVEIYGNAEEYIVDGSYVKETEQCNINNLIESLKVFR